MKKTFLLSAILMSALSLFAQTERNPYPRTITVNGTAEMEIVPDEIYAMVDLREYDKKGFGKVTIDQIRQDFLSAVRSLGLPDSAISIAAYDGYNGNPWWRKKHKKTELYSSITYQVKLHKSKQVDDLVDRLDDNATQNFYIAKTSHSKLDEFRKQLKIQAVRAAKDKAQYLAEAINERVGEAVTIREPGEYYIPYVNEMAMANVKMREVADEAAAPAEPQADFRKMKLKYDVSVVFALK